MVDAPGRDLRLDLLRGLALLAIFVDHVRDNPWREWTLRGFGLTSALDVFVLVAGVAGYLAYGSRLGRGGGRRLVKRWLVVYAAHLALVAALVVLGLLMASWFTDYPVLRFFRVTQLVHDPLRSWGEVAVLARQPLDCGILPIYLLFLPTLPLIVWGLRVRWWLPLLVGLGLFALPVFADLRLGQHSGLWRIDPLQWFVVFAAGVVLGSRAGRPLPRLPRVAVPLAVGWLVLTLLDDAPWQELPGLAGVGSPTGLLGLDLAAHPWGELLRWVSLAAWVLLIVRFVPRDAGWLRTPAARWVERVGARSLPMFCLGVLLSAAGTVVAAELGGSFAAYTLVTAVGLTATVVAAGLLARLRPPLPRVSGHG